MKRRIVYALASLVLVAFAWRLPTGWYDALPREADTPPLPFSGVSLLRLLFLVEAIVVGWAALAGWKPLPVPEAERLEIARRSESPSDLSQSRATLLMVFITLVAIVLRSYHLGSDLWQDEITTVVRYGRMPFLELIGSYQRTNNHLLNTLLVRVSIGAFGENEWAARLPAMLFGVATVPLLYWVARLALSRWASVAAASVLAVSYHHIFFSQNARGYSAALFFTLATSGLLIKAIADDKGWRWALYVAGMVLGIAALANMAFVLASHVVIGAIAVICVRRRGASGIPLARRLALVFGVAGFLSLQLYATPLPEMYVVITQLYVRPATGFAPFSMEFAREIYRGVTAGFGGIVAPLVFLVVGVAGIGILFQANWMLTAALGLPAVLTALFLIIRGLSFSPRFFLIVIPLGILAAMAAAEAPLEKGFRYARSRTASHPRRAAVLGALLVVASIASLPRYYRIPKQPYRAALAYLETIRRPGERVVVVYAAAGGIRYYVKRTGVTSPEDYVYARTLVSFDSLASKQKGGTFLVTTFPRALRADLPDIADHIERDWRPRRSFAGTIGDGDITVWARRVQ
jgi:4-amino-4-deoxy-L-arabinose transferase-like glycosyltransferase